MQFDADLFQRQRPLLFSLAYRMLGSASDADDVLQDAWVRLSGVDAGEIQSPKAYATTVVTRLCLDRLKAARTTREQYVGPWLPEPLLTDRPDGPDLQLERAESVTLAFLVLLETLSAEERAVFLLKEVFDYDHTAIARMLGLSPANSRQLLRRAKTRIAERRPRAWRERADRRELAERFAQAFTSGDAGALTGLLADDVGFWSDGGGKAVAARRPLAGRDAVHHFLLGLHRTGLTSSASPRVALSITEVNFEPAILVRVEGRLDSVFVLTVDEGVVAGIRVVRNPEKLAYLDRQLRAAG
jgi:RNA polymerase sigma-70 factor (ECF subfamily)